MKKYLLAAFAITFTLTYTNIHAQMLPISIITVAGEGAEGYHGDRGSAVNCQMHWPESVAFSDSGNLYIADAMNNVVRMVNGEGVITTIAGNGFEAGTGTGGFGGDGGPATDAELSYPSGVAVDKFGNVYIADQHNDRIRGVQASTGNIFTIVGNGTIGFGGDGGPSTAASLWSPSRIALDTFGNLFIADSGNNRIRVVLASSGDIFTLAGNGTRGSSGDAGLATAAELNDPVDIAVDVFDNVFIADYSNNKIRVVVPGAAVTGGSIYTYAGTGIAGFSGDSAAATNAYLYEPSGIVVDTLDNIYFSDLGNERIRMIDTLGNITTIAGDGTGGYNGDGELAVQADLWWPEGLALDPRGQLYIADKANNRIRELSSVLKVNNVTSPQAAIKLYPNPNTGAFTLSITSPYNEDANVTITNLTGETMAKLTAVTNKATSIDIEAPPGIYFLSAATAHGVLNEKVVVR